MKKEKSDLEDLEIIAVCVPAYQRMPVMFVTALLELLRIISMKYKVHTMINDAIPIDEARNRCVKYAQDKEAKYVLFLDTDNVVKNNTFDSLMKTMKEYDADLVTGLYFEKARPYFPVLRTWNKEWGFRKLDDFKLGDVIPIGGCGMGCALINMRVFEKLKYPWFQFIYEYDEKANRTTQLSEDLSFSREMNKAGFRMYCDTKVAAPHLGGLVDTPEFWSYKPMRTSLKKDREELINDIRDFLDVPISQVQQNLFIGHILMANEWNETFKDKPLTSENIKQFYKNTVNYLYDLTLWHVTVRRKFDIDLLVACKEDIKPRNILDFGCGIGQNGLMLAREGFDVTIADLQGATLDFARWRFKKHGQMCKIWEVDIDENPPDEKYDLIILCDVLEHIHDDEFESIVKKLISLKHKKTKIVTTNTFGKTHIHPMHMELNDKKRKLISELVGVEWES